MSDPDPFFSLKNRSPRFFPNGRQRPTKRLPWNSPSPLNPQRRCHLHPTGSCSVLPGAPRPPYPTWRFRNWPWTQFIDDFPIKLYIYTYIYIYIYIKSTYLYTVDLLEKISNCHVGCLIGRRVYICGLNLTNKSSRHLDWRWCGSHPDPSTVQQSWG